MSYALSEHEYEPIGASRQISGILGVQGTQSAPVVRIYETDVARVADSDENIDVQERRYNSNLVLDGDVIVPLDGKIEDNAMQARELGENGDTSEDQETAQQLQDRLEERFLNAATPCTESRTDAEINTSQVDSSALEELPLRRGARGFPQRLRSQAGKLRSRLRSIQRPSFSLPDRQKTDKTKTTKADNKPKVSKTTKSDKPRFSFPDKSRFSLPDRPKFNFPDRPKFSMPERPKLNIKRPNINLPSLGRVKKPLKERQHSSESNSGSKRNIFDISTYPRLFDKRSKSRGEYATSSPKASRAQSPESATVPRVKKKAPIGARWVQRFSDIKYADDEPDNAVERSKPWRRPSNEEPQISYHHETIKAPERLPWEESDDFSAGRSQAEFEERSPDDRTEFEDEEALEESPEAVPQEDVEEIERNEDSVEIENRRIIVELPLGRGFLTNPEEDFGIHLPEDSPDPRLYPRGLEDSFEVIGMQQEPGEKWRQEYNEVDENEDIAEVGQNRYGPNEDSVEMVEEDGYGRNFMPIDPPRKYVTRESTPDENSARSDREQQSSGSSGDRRRRGVLEEIDSDEFFLRAKGISQDDMNMGRFLATEIRDAFRPTGNALADQELDRIPPTRPIRTRSLRKRRDHEKEIESLKEKPPVRPKRDRRHSEDSAQVDEYETYLPDKTGSISGSRHRVIYQTEGISRAVEPLDDIVVVKPARRKSRSVARSQSDSGSGVLQPLPTPPTPPVAPRRRKRGRLRNIETNGGGFVNRHGSNQAICNGHPKATDWSEGIEFPPEVHEDLENLNPEQQLQSLVDRLDHEYIEPAPIAPKRRSRSRGTSVADDDRTSRGAESLPEVSYLEEDEDEDANAPRDTESLPGYAVVDKREKPPRPPPPRRRRDKFATVPKPTAPVVPVRPQRAYSTLGPSRKRSASPEEKSVNQMDVTPYTELDSDDPDSNDMQNGNALNKIQGRPLPAPPRPPRARREITDQSNLIPNGVVEVAAATQTDPLPDDVVIEEEITRARLVMTPSRSGSQILVSSERITTPTFGRSSPAVPPLPQSVLNDRLQMTSLIASEEFADPVAYESNNEEVEVEECRTENIPQDRAVTPIRTVTPVTLTSTLPLGEERLRIASLEVADLRVERLNVNQLEAHKISASEVDAVMVSATEISNSSSNEETAIHPSLLKELIAIRNHLEQVASSRRFREQTPDVTQGRLADKSKNEPFSAVDQLIAELEQSDRRQGESESMETSETVDGPTLTLTEAEGKSPESVESVQEVSRIENSVNKETRSEEGSKDNIEKPKTEAIDQSEVPPSVNNDATSQTLLPSTKESELNVTHNTMFPEKSQIPDTVLPSSSPQEIPVPQTMPSLSAPPIHPILKADGNEYVTENRPFGKDEEKNDKRKSSRSRSSSPATDGKRPVRQTASPVRSLPPLISVTPDRPDPVPCPVPEVQVLPQRATVSYVQNREEEVLQRPTVGATQFVAFPTSQIPANFFSLASPVSNRLEPEPTIGETTQQLLRAMRIAGTRAMRHFVGYVSSRVSVEDRGEKTKEIELALCALLLLIAGLLILCFGSPRTVTHHHHWDYFNPPQ